MIEVSISVEGRVDMVVLEAMAEANGYSGPYRSDHLTMPDPPDEASLECIVSLAYLADHTGRPAFVSRSGHAGSSAAAQDGLSDGRPVTSLQRYLLSREP